MTYVMVTCPRKYVKNGRTWLEYFRKHDCHKWIIALEHGSNGLVHWQIRFKARGCETKEEKETFFRKWKDTYPEAHIEFTENWCNYERKEGTFVSSDDSKEVISVRFGTPNSTQRNILATVESQNTRQVDCWLDPVGCHGKSWLSLHLYEKGKALLVPRYCSTPRELSAYICSAYAGQPYIIIDIPRAGTINQGLYETIEEIKDGAVFDPRYHGTMRNIRGAKVIIFTNKKLDVKKLSHDRWRLHGFARENEHS